MNLDNENIFDKIKELFGKVSGNLNVLEEQIDIELQMEYFKASKKLKENPVEDIILRKQDLYDENISLKEKKQLLVMLASVDDVEAFRTIEKYTSQADPKIYQWSILALQESRMILESSLLDENQVFISTGLGGKGSKLRYFIVLMHHEKSKFNDIQQKVIQSEFDFSLNKHDGELESVNFSGPYAKLLAVIPIQAPLKELFQNAIHEANQIGDFIKENFIVTNVKQLTDNEITDFLEKEGDNDIEAIDDGFDDYDDEDDLE